jgi:hypothetical protein
VDKRVVLTVVRHSRDSQMEYWHDLYRKTHPEEEGLEIVPRRIAEWIKDHPAYRPKFNLVDLLTRRVTRHLRNSHVLDPDGLEVHEHISIARDVVTPEGKKRVYRYLPLFDVFNDDLWMNLQRRRNGTLAVLTQMARDRKSWNKYNRTGGDVPELSFDFTADVEEKFLPTQYPSAPKKKGPDDEKE